MNDSVLYSHMIEPGDRLWVMTPDSPALMERIIWELWGEEGVNVREFLCRYRHQNAKRRPDIKKMRSVTFIASTSTYGLSFSTVSPSCCRNLTILPVTSERSSEGL